MGTSTAPAASEAADALDALLSDLNLTSEPTAPVELAEVEIEAAIASAEAQEAVNAANVTQDEKVSDIIETLTAGSTESIITPAEAAPATPEAPKADKKAKKEKKAKEPKPPKEPKAEKPKTTRKHYASRSAMVEDKMGDLLAEYSVLELSDAALSGDDLKAKQNETMECFKAAGKKVQNRMSFFMFFASGKSATLNGVCLKALNLLKADGKLVSGIEGNYHKCLIAHPYSVSAAKAMGGNTLLAMQKLKMIVQGEDKQTFVPNPNSLYLAKLNSMLGLV